MKKIISRITAFCIVFLTLNMIFFPNKACKYAKDALDLCLNIIVPSIFPFLILSGLFISLGLAKECSFYLSEFMRKIFNLPGSAALAFVNGIISGYPVGAKCVVDLYELGQCSKIEAERMLAFCNNSGPLFILGSIGILMLKNKNLGILLYVSHVFSSIIVGIIFGFYKINQKSTFYLPNSKKSVQDSVNSIFLVISSSVQTMLNICAVIIMFSIFTNFLPKIPGKNILNFFITGLFEVSNAIFEISKISSISMHTKLIFISFILSCSGISVLLQVSSIISKTDISICPYIFGKFLQSIISSIITSVSYIIINKKFNFIFEKTDQCMKLEAIDLLPKTLKLEAYGVIFLLIFLIATKKLNNKSKIQN